MKLTKYEHACLVLEISDEKLIVDPGAFSTPLGDLGDVRAIVITHEHPDHWTPEQLDRILARNPDVTIYGPAGVALAATGYDITTVTDGDTAEVGPFQLAFYGSRHAVIHSSIPVIDNVGVLVNNTLFYPGDSFTVPPVAVDTLAVPSAAPWLKIGEAMDYVTAVAPKRSFPTHEMVASVIGKGMANDRLRTMTEAAGGQFFPLEPNDTLDL
jgi:L-ascorbate metabolism protein UlaG (beta-lactamase superfamily)